VKYSRHGVLVCQPANRIVALLLIWKYICKHTPQPLSALHLPHQTITVSSRMLTTQHLQQLCMCGQYTMLTVILHSPITYLLMQQHTCCKTVPTCMWQKRRKPHIHHSYTASPLCKCVLIKVRSPTIIKITILSQENDTDVAHCNFNAYQPSFVIFGRDVAERICYQMEKHGNSKIIMPCKCHVCQNSATCCLICLKLLTCNSHSWCRVTP